LLAAAVFFRQGWLKLFGPVLFYDMVRSGRRGRHILLRTAYASILLLLMWSIWWSGPVRYREPTVLEAANLAQIVFETMMAVQLAAVALLTPAYVAGAIADEKNRKTLEFLLATDLRSREIVLSKLVSRLSQMALLLLTGLPILSLLQFLGGIDPHLVLAGFAGTGLTMYGLGGVSIVQSIYHKQPRNAIAVTYLIALAYLALSVLAASSFARVSLGTPTSVLASAWRLPGDFHRAFFGSEGPLFFFTQLADVLVQVFVSGNPVFAIAQVKRAIDTNLLDANLPIVLGNFALFHGLLGTGSILVANLRLRPVAMRQASGGGRVRRRWRLFHVRPPVSNVPMLWKELHIEGGIRLHWLGMLIVLALVLVSFYPLAVIGDQYINHRYLWVAWEEFTREINIWVRFTSAAVACLLLLAVAVRASTCISGERDRQTFDSLLTAPLTGNDILTAKWLGNIASVRAGWLWLGAIYLVGLFTGALHPLALGLLFAAWFVYAGFLSMLGCWYSLMCRSGLRATVATLVTTALSVSHWLLWLCCIPLMAGGRGGDPEGLITFVEFQVGVTPPLALGFLAFWYGDFQPYVYSPSGRNPIVEVIIFVILGMGIWFLATLWLRALVLTRFRELTNRRGEGVLIGWYSHPPIRNAPAQGAAAPSTRPTAELKGAVLVEETWSEPQPPVYDDKEAKDEPSEQEP
jgi:ABC-type transport system involved in multi-copper enzyme maturation permease subunit